MKVRKPSDLFRAQAEMVLRREYSAIHSRVCLSYYVWCVTIMEWLAGPVATLTDDERCLRLCLMAAIAESEGI